LDKHLTPDHRLLIMSQVANIDGRRLPVAEATQIARARGVITLIDGAQSVGGFPVNVQEIGADFYSGSAHKWLMGPEGCGILYIHRDVQDSVDPVEFGWTNAAAAAGLVLLFLVLTFNALAIYLRNRFEKTRVGQ